LSEETRPEEPRAEGTRSEERRPEGLDPAIALVDLDSVAVGIVTADAMVKAAPVGSIYTGTVHPGRYLVLVSGDTASVEEALAVGLATGGGSVVDSVFLADVHPAVSAAIVATEERALHGGEALGIVETATVATVIDAADAAVKAAAVELAAVRLADGLGGKGYALIVGAVADVEAAIDGARSRVAGSTAVISYRVVAQLHDEVAVNLERDLRFNARLVARPGERGG